MKITRLIRILAGAVAAAVLLLACVGCGAQKESAPDDDSLQKILDKGELILGLDVNFPPLGFIDETGEIVGFDIDVAQEVCDRLGVRLVKRGIDWDKKEDELNGGSIDCIWNGMSVTPAREKSMTLSDPYMKNELIVVVQSDSADKTLRDLEGKKIGVQAGSSAQDALKESKLFSKKIKGAAYDTVATVVEKLDSGEVAAALIDSVSAYYFVFSSNDTYYILPGNFGEEEYAVGFRKGDFALRDKVQETINEMKVDGTLGNISKKWFGSDITTVR